MTGPGSEIPPGSVVITPQDMWDAIGRIEKTTEDIRATIAPQVGDLRSDHDDLKRELSAVQKDHETRIRAVEKANWKQAGIYAAITVIATIGEAMYYTTHH